MTKQEIMREAWEAGFGEPVHHGEWYLPWDAIERFAERIAFQEREACVQLALQGTGEAVQTRTLKVLQSERQRIAAAIRGRGEK
jgi:hypothetical protein